MAKELTLREHLRRAGSVTSKAKAAASRKNAKLGGRPPKFAVGDRVRAGAAAQKAFVGRLGKVIEIGPRKSQFRVRFSDARNDAGVLMSWWLEKV